MESYGKGGNPIYTDGALRGDMVKLVTRSSSAPILSKGVLFTDQNTRVDEALL